MLQRSRGISRMPLLPSTSSRQNDSGSFAPPGKRQPTPTIATGGVSRGPRITSVVPAVPGLVKPAASEVPAQLDVGRGRLAQAAEERGRVAAEEVGARGDLQPVGHRITRLGPHDELVARGRDNRGDLRAERLAQPARGDAEGDGVLDLVQLVVDQRLLDGDGPGETGDSLRIAILRDHAQDVLEVDVPSARQRAVGAEYQKEERALDLVAGA